MTPKHSKNFSLLNYHIFVFVSGTVLFSEEVQAFLETHTGKMTGYLLWKLILIKPSPSIIRTFLLKKDEDSSLYETSPAVKLT